MSYLTNSPDDKVVLRLQARKSFALGLWIQDQNGNPLDITGVTIRLVIRKSVPKDTTNDSGNLISSSTAVIQDALAGYAKFSLQAAELDEQPGEYLFSIVLVSDGYSSTIVDGLVQIEQNTEFTSTTESYAPNAEMATSLAVLLRGQNTINVRTGPSLAPGAVTFTHEDEKKLDELYAGAVAEGETLNADMIPDGLVKVIMTKEERDKLANLEMNWDDIQGKPLFGDIITHDAAEFIKKREVNATTDITAGTIDKARVPLVTALRGIVITTAAPPAGNPGVMYLKYTP